ncbi:MAG: hypothetical protein VKN33_01305 [Candidatus Sericytochromatia bacterium]|nr:hypothetical protein [Candidatus Sericytochromatia bacterium]
MSNNSSGIISNRTGNLLGKAKFNLRQHSSAEVLLADAVVTLQDAAGRVLVNDRGEALSGQTDQAGGFTLSASLPDENLVLRIGLWHGGELMAIVGKQSAKARTIDIDTASTLGASYVLQQYVRGDQATFDKLPPVEAERLRKEIAAVVPLLEAPPSYQAAESVSLTTKLRAKAPGLNAALQDIEVLMLGGLGNGKRADETPLNRPRTIFQGRGGELYIGEDDFGRIRRVENDGKMTTFADGRGGLVPDNFPRLSSLVQGPGDGLFVVSRARRKVFLITPGKDPVAVVGNGEVEGVSFLEGPANQTACLPYAAAYDPQRDQLWVAQREDTIGGRSLPNRLFRVDASGNLSLVPLPAGKETEAISSLAVAADGSVFLIQGRYLHRLPLAGEWVEKSDNLQVKHGSVTPLPDGALLIAEDAAGRVIKFTREGQIIEIPGPSDPALALREPVSAVLGASGALLVADYATNLILDRSADGVWRRFAGANALVQTSQGQYTFNTPAGIAFDAENRMLVSESSGHAIKRLDGTRLAVIAGGAPGYTGDNGPAGQATLNFPGPLVYHQATLYVSDVSNGAIRAIDESGFITTRVGGNTSKKMAPIGAEQTIPAMSVHLDRTGQIAVGPDGTIYWTAFRLNQIYRCSPEGEIRLLAGAPVGPGFLPPEAPDGPAYDIALAAPFGLAFKPGEPENLYFSELANCRVRCIRGIRGNTPSVETVAGIGRIATLLKVAQPPGWESQDTAIPALQAALVLPTGLAFDARGTMYVGEGGSANLSDFGGALDFLAGLRLEKTAARIRTIDHTGIIRTLVGPGGKLHANPNEEGAFGLPTMMTFDGQGRLAVVDTRNNSVRIIPAEAL